MIRFFDGTGRRCTIRLGRMPKRQAEAVKRHIEHLVSAKLSGAAPPDDTSHWLSNIDHKLHGRLARAGLVKPLQSEAQRQSIKLESFLADYAARRTDVKADTREIWQRAMRNLREFFGNNRDMRTIHEGDADDFKMDLIRQELAPTTIEKRLEHARMFFKSAVRRKLIAANPFSDVKPPKAAEANKQIFVERETVERLLAVCDPTWQVIVALNRYGGLRCPSEVLSLRWQDINWERGRMVVHSPKTEHHPGKATRSVPLFPEIRGVLEDAFERAAEGAEYVVDASYREKAFNKERG